MTYPAAPAGTRAKPSMPGSTNRRKTRKERIVLSKTILVDIDNTVADYTNGLRDYIRECGHGEDECPCPEPTGQWSLDIMRDGDEYWLIDMAPAERSTFYGQAVPASKRRPMVENWIPELEGE